MSIRTFAIHYFLCVASEVHPIVLMEHVEVLGLCAKILRECAQGKGADRPTALGSVPVEWYTKRLSRLDVELIGLLDAFSMINAMDNSRVGNQPRNLRTLAVDHPHHESTLLRIDTILDANLTAFKRGLAISAIYQPAFEG